MAEEMSVEEARRRFADLLNSVQWGRQHVELTRHGKRAAVLVPVEWYDRAIASVSAATDED